MNGRDTEPRGTSYPSDRRGCQLKEKGSTDVVEFPLPYIDSLTPKGKRLFVKKLKQKFAQRGVELKKAVFV